MADDLLPTQSAAAAVASDDAVTQNPSNRPQILEIGPTASLTDTEFGTNPPVITGVQSQSVNNDAFAAQYETTGGERDVWPGGEAGVAASSDDSGTKQNTAQVTKNVSGIKITPRGNVLDKYASYTYNLSWYIMAPGTYATWLKTPKKNINGLQLLMRSGGAGTGSAGSAPTASTPQGQIDASVTEIGSRNKFFNLDYYIDNLELESLISGPATGSPHNVTSLKFNVTEPNGLTLINNLWQAVNDLYKTTNLPYAQAHFCMVIRFYGYDDNGNLVRAGTGTTDPGAVIEKFYPFTISNIQFRVSNHQIEYHVEGLTIQSAYALGTNVGIVKEPIELSGTTIGQILGGQSQSSDTVPADDGRQSQIVPNITVGDGVLEAQAASNTVSSEFTNTQQPNLVSSSVTGIPGVNSSF